jgi:pimeloyl-ACP methyl ester carboxylesterase
MTACVDPGRPAAGGPPTRVDLDGGPVEVAWLPGARPDLAPLVFLHEGLGSLRLWRGFPAAVVACSGRSALVWSRHGYGASGPARRPRPVSYLHDEAAGALPELLDSVGIDAPILVGHSDGASIALIHAGRDVRPVGGIVAMAPHVVVEDRTIAGIEAARRAWAGTDLADRMARHHDDPAATFTGWNDVWLSPPFRRWTIEADLPGVTCPVLALQCAEDDYGTADQLRRIAAGVAGPVRTHVVAAAGHAPHLVAPDEVTALVADWLVALP